MKTLKSFRFAVIAHNATSEDEWRTRAKRIEQLGYATLFVPDHPGAQLAPVPAILAAADATKALRVEGYVFNNDFRHPVMVAKEAATLDVLADGRFEPGLGAGYDRSEYEQCGILYCMIRQPFGAWRGETPVKHQNRHTREPPVRRREACDRPRTRCACHAPISPRSD